MCPRSSSGLFHISTSSELAVCFRCLSSLPISLIRQLSRSQPSRLHPLTSKTAHVSTRTDSHRAVELTVLVTTERGRGTVIETGLQMLTASGITADLICQIMTVSKSVSTDTGRHAGKDDRGHKDSKRRHRDRDDTQISGRDDRHQHRREGKAKTEVRGDRDDRGVSSTEGQAAAAGSAAQDSGWVTFSIQFYSTLLQYK